MQSGDDAGKPAGKRVFEVLIKKHLEQRIPDEEDCIPREKLSHLIDIAVSCSQIEQAAKKLSGSAGISGFDSYQLQRVLLRYGKHSEKLRESFANATKIKQIKFWIGKKCEL